MAVYRQVHVSFWQDPFILELTPEEKYFYLYLMTNSKTKQCGVYELPKKVMELETGYNRETIDKLLDRFIGYGKIEYCAETKEVYLKNWLKYNSNKSPKVKQCIEAELLEIKHSPFRRKTMDSLYIDSGEEKEEEKEKEKEEEKEASFSSLIFSHWNGKHIIEHRKLTDKLKRAINGALKDYTPEEITQAIDNYHRVLTGPDYYWTHKWTLKEFLERGLDKFRDWEVCHDNYLTSKGEKPRGSPGKQPTDEDYLKAADNW